MLNMKIIRMKKGLKQKELARRLGVRQATIADIENERVKPRAVTVEMIAKELGASVGVLMRRIA